MRTSLSLALSLSINIALASENIKNDAINAAPVCSQIIYSDESDTTTRGALSDQRRRGDFEVKDDEKSTPPHVWALNIASETSRFCYIAQEEVSIWLPQREQTGSVVIKNVDLEKLNYLGQLLKKPWPGLSIRCHFNQRAAIQ